MDSLERHTVPPVTFRPGASRYATPPEGHASAEVQAPSRGGRPI